MHLPITMHIITRLTLLCLVIYSSEVSAAWLNTLPPQFLDLFGISAIGQKKLPIKLPFKTEDVRKRGLYNVIAGLDTVKPINQSSCMHHMIRSNSFLSSSVECARTCRQGEPPKTCYYHFVLERYDVNGQACRQCIPDDLNRHCPNCQCVPGDGVNRMALTVNRMIPGPSIEVCKGDYVVVDVENLIKGEAVTIHWHGVYQKDYQYYDGVPYVTQCPITDSTTFRYQFRVKNAGTHFYHGHSGLHKMDGLFGPLIVREPAATEHNSYLYNYDLSEHVMLINDWMNEHATNRYPGRRFGEVGQLPNSILINGKGQYTSPVTGNRTTTPLQVFKVRRNGRYRFRLINSFCTVCPAQLTIQDHSMTVIATDGQHVKPVVVQTINSFAGERYDFVINANQRPGAYWIQVRAVGPCENRQVQQVAILLYEGSKKKALRRSEPTYAKPLPYTVLLNPLTGVCNPPKNDTICISTLQSVKIADQELIRKKPDIKLFMPLATRRYPASMVFKPNTYMQFLAPRGNETIAAVIDGISFKFPPSPPISQPNDIPPTQYCNSKNLPSGCKGNCSCTHMINIPYNAIVEIFLVDEFQARGVLHPFHLHGHSFQVLSMGQPFNAVNADAPAVQAGTNKLHTDAVRLRRMNVNYAIYLDKQNKIQRYLTAPPRKDTIPIPNNGFTVLRFRANNPGYWLFHCHFIYHQMVGMDLILHVGEQADLPPVPPNFPKCGNFKPPIMY